MMPPGYLVLTVLPQVHWVKRLVSLVNLSLCNLTHNPSHAPRTAVIYWSALATALRCTVKLRRVYPLNNGILAVGVKSNVASVTRVLIG
jgi:hypothetical protein